MSNYKDQQEQFLDHNPWSGRETNPSEAPVYWYQHVRTIPCVEDFRPTVPEGNNNVVILGYASDDGVRRNLGRLGAENGPRSIRDRLGKLSYHHRSKIWDAGDVTGDIQSVQSALANSVSQVIQKGGFPIVLGGGHDLSYAHFDGVKMALADTPKTKIGIINFDAHLDLRDDKDGANSGTPFYQILTQHPESKYLPIGIQKQANTRTLFETASKLGVEPITKDQCNDESWTKTSKLVKAFTEKVDVLYVTVDLDGFAASVSPGVSAPSPTGLSPEFVLKVLKQLVATNKVIAFDVAECNPTYDQDQATARLAAILIDEVVGML